MATTAASRRRSMPIRDSRRTCPRAPAPAPPIRPAAAGAGVAALCGLVLLVLAAVPASGPAPSRPGGASSADGDAAATRRALQRIGDGRRRAEAARASFTPLATVQSETRRYVAERAAFLRGEIARLDALPGPDERDRQTREEHAAELRRLAPGR